MPNEGRILGCELFTGGQRQGEVQPVRQGARRWADASESRRKHSHPYHGEPREEVPVQGNAENGLLDF